MIKKMKLLTLSIEGYRKFKEKVEINFSEGINQIFADNANGKTTVYFALAWLVTGQNFEGKKNELEIINDESEYAVVDLSFEDETGTVRNLKRKLTKASQSIRLDDVVLTQKNIERHINSSTFLSILNPLFFLDMDTNSMRTFLQEHTETIEVKDIISLLSQTEVGLILNHFNGELSQVTNERLLSVVSELKDKLKKSENSLIIQNGMIEKTKQELVSIVVEEVIAFDESILIKLQNELKELELSVPVLDVQKTREYEEKRETLAKLKKSLKDIQDEYIKKLEIKKNLDSQLAEKEGLTFSNKAVYELKNIQEEIVRLTKSYRDAKALSISLVEAINVLKVVAETNPKVIEPTTILEKLNQEQLDSMKTIKATGDNAREKETQLKLKLEQDEVKFNQDKVSSIENIKKQIGVIVNELQNNELSRTMFEKENTAKLSALEIELNNSNFSDYVATIESEAKKINELIETKKAEIVLVEVEKKKIDTVIKNNLASTTLKSDKEMSLENSLKLVSELEKEIQSLNNDLNAFYSYQIKRSELSSASISKYFNDVSFVFEKFVKTTGEMKPCLDVFYEGKSLNKASTSQLIKAGLEISEVISRLSGCDYPIVIDNSESITRYSLMGANQVIEMKVVANVPLTIKIADGTETVLQPIQTQQVA